MKFSETVQCKACKVSTVASSLATVGSKKEGPFSGCCSCGRALVYFDGRHLYLKEDAAELVSVNEKAQSANA